MKKTKKYFKVGAVLFCATVALSSCGTVGKNAGSLALENEKKQLQTNVSDLKQELADARALAETRKKEVQAAEERARSIEMRAAAAEKEPIRSEGNLSGDLFPPNAKVGECYARVFVPHTMKQITEQKLVREESERIEVIPATYETVQEKVLVKEESEKVEIVPAVYGWAEEQVMVEPAKTRLVEVPAEYGTITEQVLVREAHTAWKKGTGPIQKVDEATGEIMCLVEIPAQYKTVTKTVLKSPATTREITIPAVYDTVRKQVMKSPPTTKVVTIPAEYKTVSVKKLVDPAQERRIRIPAEYQTVTRNVVDKEGHMEWREILCETNMTRDRISRVQRALMEAGYDPGPIDGKIGGKTMNAVNRFQRDKNLVASQYLTVRTLEALGVNPR